MKLFKEIQGQPEHIKEVFVWLCAIIVFSVVLLAGFRQTEEKLVALINPEVFKGEETFIAKEESKLPSPLASFGEYFKSLRASVTDIFNFKGGTNEVEVKNDIKSDIPPALLPLAD